MAGLFFFSFLLSFAEFLYCHFLPQGPAQQSRLHHGATVLFLILVTPSRKTLQLKRSNKIISPVSR